MPKYDTQKFIIPNIFIKTVNFSVNVYIPLNEMIIYIMLSRKNRITVLPQIAHLTLSQVPISQNGQTHSNNSLANCLSVLDHFVGLALKGLREIVLLEGHFLVKLSLKTEDEILLPQIFLWKIYTE